MKPTTRKKQENLNGNFGAPRVQAKRDTLDLSPGILNKENLRIPDPDKSFTLLVQAYNRASDPRLKATLWDMLKKRKATLQPTVIKHDTPTSEYWEMVRRVR